MTTLHDDAVKLLELSKGVVDVPLCSTEAMAHLAFIKHSKERAPALAAALLRLEEALRNARHTIEGIMMNSRSRTFQKAYQKELNAIDEALRILGEPAGYPAAEREGK